MNLIFITNDPMQAQTAIAAGVDIIMVDLELLGKKERQANRNTLISNHTIKDVERIQQIKNGGQLMVRINPINEASEIEIEEVLSHKVDHIMLPMFTCRDEIERLVDLIRGRSKICLLLETPAAMVRIDDIMGVGGIDSVHIGLNDLHISLGLDFMFELMAGELMDYLANRFKSCQIPFGVGGVARMGFGDLPAELIISEHMRLGSTQVILSRDYQEIFKSSASVTETELKFKQAIHALRSFLLTEPPFSQNRTKFKKIVREIANRSRILTTLS